MSKAFKKVFGWVGAIVSIVFGGRKNKNLSTKKSYTYGDGALQTNISTTAPIPIIYGTVKVAGNLVYSRLSENKKVIYKVISLCDGLVKEIRDLQLDDLPIDSPKFKNVSWNTYLGDGKQEIDDRVPGGTQEMKARLVGSLKYHAYVSMQAEANENLNGSFNFTCLVDGSVVKKYNNANDLSDYKEEFSNNPAWCVLDFMTRYNGCGMDIGEIDVQSFIDGAKFFDEKKYTLNLCIDEQRSRLEWIQYMLNCCKAMLVYRAGKYSLFVEKEDEVVQKYTPSDIKNLAVWFSPLAEVPDIYRVTYIDPENAWVKVNAEASLAPESYLRHQPLVETLELMGVTNFDQASRLAWFYLNQAVTCQTYVEFETDRRALNRTVGDVIEVTDYVTEFIDKKFRIIKIEDTQLGSIKLTCREYNPDIYSEQRGATSPVINITNLSDPLESPPKIVYVDNVQDYYLLPDKTVVSNVELEVAYADFTYAKGFQVNYRKKNSDEWQDGGFYDAGQYKAIVSDMEIFETYIFRFQNVSKFNKVSEYSYSPEIYITGNNKIPNTPLNFRGEEVVGGFQLYWDYGEADIDHYELYTNVVSEETKVAGAIKGDAFYYSAGVGQYKFLLVAVDTVGNRSVPAILELEIARPRDVGGFDCVQNERNIEFHWDRVEGASYYILKEGENWEYGNILAKSSGHFFSYPYAEATSTVFWLKAYTDKGISCENPAYCTLTVAPIPDRNQIFEYDGIKDKWTGRKYNTHINADGLQLDTGRVYGDYTYNIELDQEYCARNWTEKTIKPVSEQLELQWKDAHFRWNSEDAKRRMWFPLGTDDLYNSWTEICTYSESNKDAINDRLSLNETLVSDYDVAPLPNYGVAPTYGENRYEKGLLIDGKCRPKWEGIELDNKFSISFTMYTPLDSVNDYSIYTLRNDNGDYLWLHYRALDDSFVVTLSTGQEYALKDFSGKNDFLSFIVSQGDGYFTFVVYSLAYDSFILSRERFTNTRTYNKFALYGDF